MPRKDRYKTSYTPTDHELNDPDLADERQRLLDLADGERPENDSRNRFKPTMCSIHPGERLDPFTGVCDECERLIQQKDEEKRFDEELRAHRNKDEANASAGQSAIAALIATHRDEMLALPAAQSSTALATVASQVPDILLRPSFRIFVERETFVSDERRRLRAAIAEARRVANHCDGFIVPADVWGLDSWEQHRVGLANKINPIAESLAQIEHNEEHPSFDGWAKEYDRLRSQYDNAVKQITAHKAHAAYLAAIHAYEGWLAAERARRVEQLKRALVCFCKTCRGDIDGVRWEWLQIGERPPDFCGDACRSSFRKYGIKQPPMCVTCHMPYRLWSADGSTFKDEDGEFLRIYGTNGEEMDTEITVCSYRCLLAQVVDLDYWPGADDPIWARIEPMNPPDDAKTRAKESKKALNAFKRRVLRANDVVAPIVVTPDIVAGMLDEPGEPTITPKAQLLTIFQRGDFSIAELERLSGYKKSRVYTFVVELEAEGLVVKKGDRRNRTYGLPS